jgi:hypothetical protein
MTVMTVMTVMRHMTGVMTVSVVCCMRSNCHETMSESC